METKFIRIYRYLEFTGQDLVAAGRAEDRRALEIAGVEFIDENGGGPGVRLRKGPQKKR